RSCRLSLRPFQIVTLRLFQVQA
ncbi:MAG: hypothetical protein V7632_4913, partial [Bradyrhizobium sp.]